MMSDRSLVLGALITVLGACFTSCVTSPETPGPAALAEAISFTEQGRAAFLDGRFKDAELSYAAALNVHRAFDNHTGIIRNLQNLAVVQHADGRRSDARESLATLDRYLSLREQSSPNEVMDKETTDLLGEAGWLRTRMWMDEGNWSQAQQALSQAMVQAGQSKNPRLYNLQARLSLAQGDASGAKISAEQAWAASRGTKDGADQADAARFQGKATEKLGQYSAAHRWYEKARVLDQKLARSGLVADDLLGLARTSLQMQNPTQAQAFALRALQAAQAANDASRVREAQSLILGPISSPPHVL